MKQIIFSLLVVIAFLSACTKDDINSQLRQESISASSLPENIRQYIADNYPDETIVTAVQLKSGSASYVVTLNTLESLAFASNGDFMGNGEMFCINDSTGNGNGPGGGHKGNGHHGGDPRPGDSLNHPHDSLGHPHDSLGNGPHNDSIGGGHPGGGPGNGNMRRDSVPAFVNAYVTANFAGFTARHAEQKPNCQFGTVYEVMLTKDSLQPLKIFFSLSEQFLMQAQRALYTDAPQAVKDYIAANYAGYNVKTKMEVYLMADNSNEYRIFMNLNKTRKTVLLKPDGTLVCTD